MVKPTVRSIASLSVAEQAARSIARARLGELKQASATCKKPVWISCFFDGTGNNFGLDGRGSKVEEEVSYSNVSKLWNFAHPRNDRVNRVHGLYIEGVGTPCKLVGDSGDGIDKATGMSVASKGEARIKWMLGDLQRVVNLYMPTISQINVAVFGFSRGAAQARAFVRLLGAQCERQGADLLWIQSGGAPNYPKLVVYFLGIFDTVASVGFGGSRLEKSVSSSLPALGFLLPPLAPIVQAVRAADGGGHSAWAKDLRIPPYVRHCEHFVAAHEVREKFPSDSVREDQALPGNCCETFYPGAHSDVGGGYKDGEQEGRSNRLSRIPLCNMYLAAYAAGVPFFPPETIEKNAGNLFHIDDELKSSFEVYMRTVGAADRLELQVINHMNAYYHWRWGRTLRQREREKARLAIIAKGGQVVSAIPDPYTSVTDAEWEEDVAEVAAKKTGHFKRRTVAHEDVIFNAWKGTLRKSLPEQERKLFDLFFDRYVHDSVAGFKNQMSDAGIGMVEQSRWSRNRQYFLGKRGAKFLYWRYEGDNPASAEAQLARLQRQARPDEPASDSEASA
jgi:hypothetical protein